MPDDDTLTAEVAFLRFRHRKTALPTGEPVCDSDRHAWPCHADRALRAVEAALEFHRPLRLYASLDTAGDGDGPCRLCGHDQEAGCHFEADTGDWLCRCAPQGAVCETCGPEDSADGWPCAEYEAIAAALTGEDKPGD